jgi:hypothetical protein
MEHPLALFYFDEQMDKIRAGISASVSFALNCNISPLMIAVMRASDLFHHE